MPEPKVPSDQLLAKVIAAGIQQKIDDGEVTEVVQSSVPSKALSGGRSEMVTFYDLRGYYLSTYHRLIRRDGTVHTHNHPHDAVINGTKFYDP